MDSLPISSALVLIDSQGQVSFQATRNGGSMKMLPNTSYEIISRQK